MVVPGNHRITVPVLLFVLVLVGSTWSGCGNEGDPFGVGLESTLSIESISPPDGATGVSTKILVSIAFPVDVDTDTLGTSNIVLQDGSGRAVAGALAYEATSRIATLKPSSPLAGDTRYQIVIHGIRSSTGILFRSTVSTFSTGSNDPGGAPELIGVSPLPGQQSVSSNATIGLSFSEAMNRASVEAAFRMSPDVAGTFTWSDGDRHVDFRPGALLRQRQRYYVTVLNTATDNAGNPLSAGMSWYFETDYSGSFRILETVPADGAVTVPADTTLRYVFSAPVDRTTVVTNFEINPSMTVDSTRFSYEQNDQVVSYNPPSPISAGTTVRATWNSYLSGRDGSTLGTAQTLSFTIEAIPPTVVAPTDPANGATEVAADKVVKFTFSEALDPSTVTTSNFTVEQPSGVAVGGSLNLENNGRTIAFTPASPFSGSAGQVVVTAGHSIADLGGTPMGTSSSSDVTIAFSIDATPPVVSFQYPSSGATDVSTDAAPTIILQFDESMNQSATEAGFSIAPGGGGGVFGWASSSRMHYTTSNLAFGTAYTVTYNAVDLAGNTLSGSFSFTTVSSP